MKPDEERLFDSMTTVDRAALTKFLASRKALDDMTRERQRLESALSDIERRIEEEKRVFEAARTAFAQLFTQLSSVPPSP